MLFKGPPITTSNSDTGEAPGKESEVLGSNPYSLGSNLCQFAEDPISADLL